MIIRKLVLLVLIFGVSFCLANFGSAFEKEDLAVKIFDKDLNLDFQFNFLPDEFYGEIDFDLADIDGDKDQEIIFSFSDQENDSKIVIYEKNGVFVREFNPYVKGFKGTVYLASADLDNNGKEEIITGAGVGGGPQVRIFDQYGNSKFVTGFWADDPDTYRNGVRVAAGDINGDGLQEIITSTFTEKMKIEFFNRYGQKVLDAIELDEGNFFDPGQVFAMDLGQDGINELVINYGFGHKPELQILRKDGSQINSFFPYHPGFGGGVDLSGGDDNGEKIFVTGAGFTGGPHVRFLNSSGEPVKNPTFFVYPKDYKGGVNVEAADIDNDQEIEFIVAPKIVLDPNNKYWSKYIEVDISKQKLYAYQYNKLIDSFYVSTGRWGFGTPPGEFKIFKKRASVYMRGYYGEDHPENYDLPGVPWVLSFNGPYTIHGTYWHRNFGYRMSHGCVNMYTPDSKWLYEWAPIGTPVIVHNGDIEEVLGTKKDTDGE